MVYLLFWLTTLINVIGLALALCLGLYVVTRTPRVWLTWIAALALWSLAGFFLYNALAVTVPGNRGLPWLRPTVVLALGFGFHLCLLLPPGQREPGFRYLCPPLRLPGWIDRLLGSASPVVRQLPVPAAYAVIPILIVVGAIPMGGPPRPAEGPALYLSDRAPALLYPLVIAYLVVLCALAFVHQWQIWRHDPYAQRRRQSLALLVAVALSLCGGTYLGLGVWLRVDLPSLPGDVVAGIAALFFGYRVARYSSMTEGLIPRRELLYIFSTIGLFTVGYVLAAQLLYQEGHVSSALTLIAIVVVAVVSLMLYDGMRAALDRVFYRERFRLLRGNLRSLAREASMGQSLPERLQIILSGLCRTLRADAGLIALREAEGFACQATERAPCLGQTLPLAALQATETVDLPRPGVETPEGLSLLVPIYAGDEQIGALLLGPKETGAPFSDEDLLLLEDVADELSTLIVDAQEHEENAQHISQMVADFREREHALQRQMQQMLAEHEGEGQPVPERLSEAGYVELVEEALRNLHNFTSLGVHELATLKVVDWYLPEGDAGFMTHIDRGKALSQVLTDSIRKLRPAGQEPKAYSIPPRSWYQYTILYDAYVLGDLNRDIMSKLYISEGTFNRTRRRAIRGVARALQEMEQEAQERKAP